MSEPQEIEDAEHEQVLQRMAAINVTGRATPGCASRTCEQAFECPWRQWNQSWNLHAGSSVRSGHCVQSARRIGTARRTSAVNRAYGKEKVYGSSP